MHNFSFDESKKIQSVLDLIGEYFPFTINGKPLETLVFLGGLGVNTSSLAGAISFSKTGSAGTVATSLSQQLEELKTYAPANDILGINNLASLLDYETNFELGKQLGLDYCASGAGITKDISRRITDQANHLNTKHYWTIPIVSLVSQLEKYFNENKITGKRRRPGIICLENGNAGGHNHNNAKSFEETLDEFKSSNIDKKEEKIIFAGGIRTPQHYVQVLDAGFDAIQIGTLALLAEEINIEEDYRNLVLYSKKGDVGSVVSPAGLHANGFIKEGVMKKAMQGINSKKLSCETDSTKGCFANCKRMEYSAVAAGVENYGDYCIKMALWQLHTEKEIYEPGAVYFCGTEPETLFLRDYMIQNKLNSLPAKIIVGKLLAGVFDSIMSNEGLQDKHRKFLENTYATHKNAEGFTGKVLKEEKELYA